MSRHQLAKELGRAKGTIDKWEIGWSHPSRDNISALAVALGVTEAYLRDGTPMEADKAEIPEGTSNDDSEGDLVALVVKVASRLGENQRREIVTAIELTLD